MVNCEGCRFRSGAFGDLGPHCNYLLITGRIRLGQMTGEQRAEQRRTGVCLHREEGMPSRVIEAPSETYQIKKLPSPRRSKFDTETLQRLYSQGLSDEELAGELGSSREWVRAWRRKNGLKSNPPESQRRREERDAEALRLYRAGWTDEAIGKAVGLAGRTVKAWRKKNGLPANGGPKPVDWPRVRRLYMDGFNDREISEILGIHQHTVADWRQKNKLPANRFVNAENKRKEDER